MIVNPTETHPAMDEAAILARTRAYVNEIFLYMRPGLTLGD